MPDPADEVKPRPQQTAEDSFLDLLIETVELMERPARGHFLQRFIKSMTQVELNEATSLDCWEQIISRRAQLSESLGRPVALKTAMVDVLAAQNLLRMPILVEYEELKKLQINAATDALTGLYNRRLFEEYFSKELNRTKRYNQHLALVMLDLHQFKEVNDRYGHMQGDQALQAAASTLRKSMRTSDYAFRIGGDEFALLLPQTDPEQAIILCRRLRSSYEAAIRPLKLEVPLALDYGVAVCPEDAEEQEALLQMADARLYELKKTARVQPHIVQRPPKPQIPAAEEPSPAASKTQEPETPPTKRKWERVSLVGTSAYAVMSEDVEKTARVLDLSYGGVALEMEKGQQPPQSFQAVLHVPILPPVKVNLRRVYVNRIAGQSVRIGCSFVS